MNQQNYYDYRPCLRNCLFAAHLAQNNVANKCIKPLSTYVRYMALFEILAQLTAHVMNNRH